jgi:hypothetical protein
VITSYADAPLTTGIATLFAFDDRSIPGRLGLAVTMVRPEKHPANPVLPRGMDGAPDEHRAQCYGTVLAEGGRLRMWYSAMDHEGAIRAAYAETVDGVRWERPVLGLVDYRGARANNLLDIPLQGIYPCVLREDEEPDPDRRYKMALELVDKGLPWGKAPKPFGITYFATSPDGLRWKLVGEGPPNGSPLPRMIEQASLYKIRGLYHVSGQGGSPLPIGGRKIGRAMSTWQSPRIDAWPAEPALSLYTSAAPDSGLELREQFHMGAAVWNRGNVCVGVHGRWIEPAHPEEPLRCDLGLSLSNDGLHFREAQRHWRFIERDQEAEWDRELKGYPASGVDERHVLYQSQSFTNVGEKTLFWYSANTRRPPGGGPAFGNTGLATLRRDGFGYLAVRPDDVEGTFLSAPLSASGPVTVSVNADGVSEQHPLALEVTEEGGLTPLPGFALSDCVPAGRGGLDQAVRWREHATIPKGVRFRLRGRLSGPAHLYAVYLRATSAEGAR